jgi:hypothetical protein
MQLFGNATRWLVFAGVAVAMSYGLRLLAAQAQRAGQRRLEAARRTLGLPARPPASLEAESHRNEAAPPG